MNASPNSFHPLKMVGWYDPFQLLKTAQMVFISTTFGRHSDRRLLEALGNQAHRIYDYTQDDDGRARDEIWIDYVADAGDGWNSTYAVAQCLARSRLAVKDPNGGHQETQRGRILIFGGDEVYPTASRKEYKQRLVGPYEAALPHTEPPHPHLFAIPGNHDWYDSLVAFIRLFCSKEWFAGWQLPQDLSYFALKLPHGWWLLGTDVQLGSDIDAPQVEYFQKVGDRMGPEDRVVLCNAEPHWIYAAAYGAYDAAVYNDSHLAFLEKVLGRKVSVFIAGDLHHYRRHEGPDRTQKITAGGGGAFLHPTHGPDVSHLKDGFDWKKSFPDQETSRRLCRRNLRFIFHNPLFGLLTGFLYLLTAWSAKTNLGFLGFRELPFAARTAFNAVLNSAPAAFWGLAVLFGFVLFTDTRSIAYRWTMGLLHGATHLLATFFIAWGASYLSVTVFHLPFGTSRQLLLGGLMIFAGGWAAGSCIVGIYLWLSLNLFHRHSNEAFSSLAIQDWKNFLRLQIDGQGDLRIYPIGIRRVPRVWRERAGGSDGPRWESADPGATLPELIEEPIVLSARQPRAEKVGLGGDNHERT